MEDLADILKKNLGLYKKKPETFFATVKDRVVKMNEQRRNNRHDAIQEKRRIPTNMSPVVTPAPKRGKILKKEQEPVHTEKPTNKRLEMLAKWKAEKEKRKEIQKKTDKPVFKVSHIPIHVGLPDLENVNTEIKGKSFKSKFAPPNHKFKPPSNIVPIHFNSTNANSTLNQERKEKLKTDDLAKHRMVTRSQTRSVSSVSLRPNKKEQSKKTVSKNKPKEKPIEKKQTVPSLSKTSVQPLKKQGKINTSLMSPDFPVEHDINSSENEKTPKKTEAPVYISPFVTISRGRDSARKEHVARRSGKSFLSKTDTSDCTSPKAGAAYFQWLLDNQISRLQEICEQWTKYKEDENPPEEATSMIDVAIGQTNLLITKKFVQFRGLIAKCKEGDSETRVMCEDLHGFWDMMHLQINNLDKRFENLKKLRMNNWEEIVPQVNKKVVKKKDPAIKNVKASAALREAILAGRRKKQVESGNKEETERKTPQNRRSSNRMIVMKAEHSNHRNSSPGLMMMKISQHAKNVETPAKSILKSETKLCKSHSKSVLFQDEIVATADAENDLNAINALTKVKTPQRRSQRLTQNKLF